MDDYGSHPAFVPPRRGGDTLQRAAAKMAGMRQVGQDPDTGERLMQDEDRQVYLEHRFIAKTDDGKLVAGAKLLRCVRATAPRLLHVIITGVYGAPPLPIILEFEEDVMRPMHIDALRL